jgi:hypothetical protein
MMGLARLFADVLLQTVKENSTEDMLAHAARRLAAARPK